MAYLIEKTPKEIKNLINNPNSEPIILDVREKWEYDICHIENSLHIPMGQVSSRKNELNKNGLIFLDDILPINEREQKKIPIKHVYENGILKYRESWTGDVWKLVYYLLKNYNEKIEFEIFTNKNYRGVLKISLNEKINISPDALSKINNYSYEKDFIDYYMLFI